MIYQNLLIKQRLEKEKNMIKGEVEEVKSQTEDIEKSKVRIHV